MISSETRFDQTRHSKTTLFIATIYTILIVFGKNKISDKKDDEYVYTIMKDEFNDNIATNYIFYTNADSFRKYDSIDGFKSLLKAVLSSFIYLDFSSFDEIMVKRTKDNSGDNNSILNETYFYLSDDGKRDYIKAFRDSLDNKAFVWDNNGINIVRSILGDDVIIEDTYIDLLGECIVSTSKDEVLDIEGELGFFGRVKLNDKEKHFLEHLKNYLFQQYSHKHISSFQDMYDKKQYEKLSLYLEKLGKAYTNIQKKFKENVVKNNFYIPDITGQIDEELWSYCHSMARYCEINELEENFITYAKEQCKKHKSNRSLIDRYHALIFYSLNRHEITKDSLISR